MRKCSVKGCDKPGEFVQQEADALGYRWLYPWYCRDHLLEKMKQFTDEHLGIIDTAKRRDSLRQQAAKKLTAEEREEVGL